MPDWLCTFVEWRGPLDRNCVWTAIDLATIAAERVIDRTPDAPRGLMICGAAGSGKITSSCGCSKRGTCRCSISTARRRPP